jgi:hypothetical protein
MNPPPSTLEPGNVILGVFAYLDATLAPELIQDAATYPIEIDRDRLPFRSLRGVIRDTIRSNFRLQYWGCDLTKELDKFHIYCRADMADALAVGYLLTKRGENPVEALTADYCMIPRGILTWEDIDKIRAEARQDDNRALWWNFSSFYKPGDRMAEYYCPGYRGYILVRGDRLVLEYESFHGNTFGEFPRFNADAEHFEALGGTCGFLNGDFVWPDPNWVNPVTDEEEAAGRGKKQRGVMITSAEPSPGGTMQCSIDATLNNYPSAGS